MRVVYISHLSTHACVSFTLSTDGTAAFQSNQASGGNNPQGIAVHPDGGFLYAPHIAGAFLLSIFPLNASTGALLAPATTASGGNAPRYIVIHRNGSYLYSLNGGSNDISKFAINKSTGALSGLTLYSSGGTGPRWGVMNSEGSRLYVTNTGGLISTFSVDSSTGHLTLRGTVTSGGSNPFAIAIDPGNRFAFVTNSLSDSISVFSISQSGDLVGPLSTVSAGLAQPESLAILEGTAPLINTIADPL